MRQSREHEEKRRPCFPSPQPQRRVDDIATQAGQGKGSASNSLTAFGTVISAGLGFLTILSPLFGESGLVQLLPLPEGYSKIGPPLATLASLLTLLAIFAVFNRRDKDYIPWVGAASGLLLAFFLIAVYMSWVEDDRVVGVAPVWIIPSAVVALVAFVASIAALTSSFAFLGVAFLQRMGSDDATVQEFPDEQRKVERQVEQEPTPTRAADVGFNYTIESLCVLVGRAEWELLSEVAKDGPKAGYWKLYLHISGFVVSQFPAERRKHLASARSSFRVLSLLAKVLPGLGGGDEQSREMRDALRVWAGALIEVEQKRESVSSKLSESGSQDNIEMFRLVRTWFTLMTGLYAQLYGLDRVYLDVERTLNELQRLLGYLDSVTRLPISLEASQGRQHAMLVDMARNARTQSAQQRYNRFMAEVIHDLSGNNTIAEFRGGVLSEVRKKAMNLGKEMTGRSADLPQQAAVARYEADWAAASAYCIAAATAAIEGKRQGLADFETAMRRLHELAIERKQALAACRLAKIFYRTSTSIMQATTESESDEAEMLTKKYEELIDRAEQVRGSPCPD